LAHLVNTPAQPAPPKVLLRFGIRTATLMLFASFGNIGFARSLADLLWMTIILCAIIGTIRRERVFAAGLNHWDEMVAAAALWCAVMEFNRLSAV
jgi:hypothetical protein